jgi:hypothetical protein
MQRLKENNTHQYAKLMPNVGTVPDNRFECNSLRHQSNVSEQEHAMGIETDKFRNTRQLDNCAGIGPENWFNSKSLSGKSEQQTPLMSTTHKFERSDNRPSSVGRVPDN